MDLLEFEKDAKIVTYIGHNRYSLVITKFLYSSKDRYNGFSIKDKTDILNLDIIRQEIGG